jgi:microcystin degradation protein MlrC
MRVFAGGISTETNTFSPIPTGLRDFDVSRAAELEAGKVRDGSAIDAFRKCALERGWEFRFGLYASAQPAGLTVRAAYEGLRDELLDHLRAAMPVDMVLLALHGAMVAQGYDDCEGDLIGRVRELAGPDVPIGVELDLHCHLTARMVEDADVIVIFKEYPHTDIEDRAEEVFRLTADTALGKVRPAMAMFDCRMLGLYLTSFEPMRSFVDGMSRAEGEQGVLSLSLAHGFPWGDVPDCGTRMLAVTDGDRQAAEREAERWGREFHALRQAVGLEPLSPAEALDRAAAAERGPVVIADQSDNPGGGAPGDATFALRALLERGTDSAGVAMIWDPIVVELAASAGAGAKLTVRLGGKMGPSSGDPLDLEAEVVGVIEEMTQEWPQARGALRMRCGDAAALRANGIDIIVNSRRTQVFSPQVFSNFGIDPLAKRVLVIKSIQHFYAGFRPIASEILYMAAPGAVMPIMSGIPLRRVDLRKFPWQEDPFGKAP